MTGKELNKLLQINAQHALYSEKGNWYHNLKNFPGVLFDRNGYIVFSSKEDYEINSDLIIRKDLNVRKSISKLVGYKFFTSKEKELIEKMQVDDTLILNEEAVRIIREVQLILRKKSLVNKIKKLYNNTCQICGIQLKINPNICYSEVHHIKPLGQPHTGSDSLDNMICVCPNHHVLLDLKAVTLEIKHLKIVLHDLNQTYLDYHNSLIK